eukprot:7387513-Prymnesium_polylepis.3
MAKHGQIMLNMTTQCGRNGPKGFNWLDTKYNRADNTAAVHKLILDLDKFPIDEIESCIDRLISDNASNKGLVLPDVFLSAIITLKLPDACDVVTKMVAC